MSALQPAHRRRRASLARVFAIPAVLLLASAAGLILGLTGDGLPDAFSWALLAIPIVTVVLAFRRRS